MNIKEKAFKFGKLLARQSGKAITSGAKYTWEHRKELAGAAIGAAKGAADTSKGFYGHTIKEKDFADLRAHIAEQDAEYKRLCDVYAAKKSQSRHRRQALIDSLMMSCTLGVNIYNHGIIPDDIERAYEMAYPDLAREYSLKDIIDKTDITETAGYINGIKGKLFEIRYADYLNESGILPAGYTAALAENPVQRGWDLAIIDSAGNVHDLWQLKATDDISYVKGALERYPDIDIVTTEEVYNQIAMSDNFANADIINSNIANADLIESINEAFDSNDSIIDNIDLTPSIIPFLLIAYSVNKRQDLDKYGKGKEFGARAVSSYAGYIVGSAAMFATGFWPLAVGSTFIANLGLESGRRKYQYYKGLKKTIKQNDLIIERLKFKINHI